LTGIALTLLITQACGSDPGKRHNQGAEGGEAAGGEPSAPGGTQNTAGTRPILPGMAGMGGMEGQPMAPEGGAAGTPMIVEMAGAGGEAGSPVVVIPPDPELLFTVKPNAGGLVDTAVNGKTNPENFIYSSRTGSQDAGDGTNTVAITGAELGLADTDQIVSFTALQVEPTNPTYLFSVADGAEGAPPSRVYAEYWSNTNEQNYADVYFSDGSTSFRYLGEGGDQYGYNGLLAHERSLGLSDDSGEKHDDLTGLLPHDANKPLTELYFIVTPDAVGATDSAVATMNQIERGCSIFKSKLDGTNELAFSCLQLGLTKGDQIDALLMYGTDAPQKVTFSVTQGSVGFDGSAVQSVGISSRSLGATLFQSTGTGTNTLFKKPLELGLDGPVDDEIDALAVIDAPKGKAEFAGKCDATYDLFNAQQGAFTSMLGTLSIGNNVIVAHGQVATQERLVAYDATTCAMLQQLDIPSGLLDRNITALVPLAGWAAQKPLDKIELYKVETDDQASSKELRRYDTAGTLVKAYPLPDTYYWQTYVAVVYDPIGARLYLVENFNNYPSQLGLAVVPMPDAQTTDLNPEFHQLTMPCTYRPDINGVDAQGNLYLAQYQADITYRVCAYKPNGEMLPLPYVWQPQVQGEGFGFIVGQGPHFLLTTNGAAGPIAIERDGYLPPTP
jgi:hypothetical protein